ncbi:hypothetical protein [Vibrio harveyi]|uniref:hypothetical protein n=1 Tax=Vibrio harveyi TaxID=669 RepID=UPI003CFA491D
MKINDFLQRIEDDFAIQSTSYKATHSENKAFVSNYLNKLAEQNTSRPEAVIQDLLGMLHFKHKNEHSLCEYLRDAMKLADNDQHPKVCKVKDNILNHLRKSDTPSNLKPGVDYVIEQIDTYKGNQFSFMLKELKEKLSQLTVEQEEQVDFVKGAVETIDFFSKYYKNPVLGRNEESSLSM